MALKPPWVLDGVFPLLACMTKVCDEDALCTECTECMQAERSKDLRIKAPAPVPSPHKRKSAPLRARAREGVLRLRTSLARRREERQRLAQRNGNLVDATGLQDAGYAEVVELRIQLPRVRCYS